MRNIALFLLMLFAANTTFAQNFPYKTYQNDPAGLRLYTLDNGLKVYLAQNKDEPKIQTFIAVRAGSTYDPADNTGLAHYLEHMLFKGTPSFGTMDWKNEEIMLAQISDLYEKHKVETNPKKKRQLYSQIDSLSFLASKLSIANEYDKMISALGAEGTNAHTWHEETIYKNKIPANALQKFLKLESERFSHLVLRLFHTELEVVYEEFNRAQDNDYRRMNYPLMEKLFPTHPYGQQTTIGTSDHLKNPSMKAIHDYFEKYYVANNMAVILVGDLEFEPTIRMVNQYFGDFRSGEITHPKFPAEKPLTDIQRIDVQSPSAEMLMKAYRLGGIGSEDHYLGTLADNILSNNRAGLFDLELNQKKAVQNSRASSTFLNDYGFMTITATPKAGQSLEEAEQLLQQQINRLKKGDFQDWLLSAIINDRKLRNIRIFENADGTATQMYNAFVHFQDWQDIVDFDTKLAQYTKQDVVNFANRTFKDNYVIAYKRQGENTGVSKVENPGITPVAVNRDAQSPFMQDFANISVKDLQPQFINFQKAIKREKLKSGVNFAHIENPNNDLFNLYYMLDMGSENDRKLPLAIQYLNYLGTDRYTPEQIKEEFFKLGINYGVSTGKYRSYVYISGLKENLEKGVALFTHLMQNAKPNQETYNTMVNSILKSRADEKLTKGGLFWGGLQELALFGEDSELRNRFKESELRSMQPAELVGIINNITHYPHEIFYYGKDFASVKKFLNTQHQVPEKFKKIPDPKRYEIQSSDNNVYFTHYDMVQAELGFLTKDIPYNKDNVAFVQVFNSYFGSGLSSIVFQEIRESKSLAYSAYSGYRTPSRHFEPHIVMAYIGTQANKLPEAVQAMKDLMNDMPYSESQFEAAKQSVLRKIEAERITRTSVYFTHLSYNDLGLDRDIREDVYKKVQTMKFSELKNFFEKHIKGKDFNYIVIGNENEIDFDALSKLGEVHVVDAEYLFNE